MNADHFAMTASLAVQSARKKLGSAADRAALAAVVRHERKRFAAGLVQGGFTRKEWSLQLFTKISNELSRMTRARRLHVAKGEK
jgi:hypothetical protein